MPEESNLELIRAAAATLRPHVVNDRLFGDVAAALVTAHGNRHLGVCIDTGSGTGFCAEHAAIAAMVTGNSETPFGVVTVTAPDPRAALADTMKLICVSPEKVCSKVCVAPALSRSLTTPFVNRNPNSAP